MADQFSQPSGSVATSTTAKSVVSFITGSTKGVAVIGVTFSSDATITSGQYLIELVLFTTDGTGTGGTPVKYGQSQAAVTATSKTNYTVEPTTATVIDAWWLPAQAKDMAFWPMGREIYIPPSRVVTVRVTAPSGTPNIRATLVVEE